MCNELLRETARIGCDGEAYRLFRRQWTELFDEAGMSWIAGVIAGRARELASDPDQGRLEELETLVNDLLFGFGVSLLQTAEGSAAARCR